MSAKLTDQVARAEGSLARLDEQQFDRLDFNWEGITFNAQSRDQTGGGLIALSARLGMLFYTVEDGAARDQAIERIFATNRGIDGAYKIAPGGIVEFESLTLTPSILRGNELMSALTLILLEAESHLRAIRAQLRPVA